jgi:UDP-3-O-acyl N-acetylglucosamine deacetylase
LPQKTIKQPIQYQGYGILFGEEAKITLKPAPVYTGIVFNREMGAEVQNAFIYKHSLGLRNNSSKIYFTEHLLATCYGLGITNLFIDVISKEVPFGNGSCLPFVKIIKKAGVKEYREKSEIYNLKKPLIVSKNDSFILALPANILSIDCFVDFPQSKIGSQFWGDFINQNNFIKELARARTFGSYRNYEFIKKILSFEVIKEKGLIIPKVFHYNNEAVRHKVLDLLGNLALLGGRLNAKIFAYKPSHKLNHQFVRKLEEL